MKTPIPDSILSLTLGEIGFGGLVGSGTNHPISEPMKIDRKELEAIREREKKNPGSMAQDHAAYDAENKARTVREVIEGWEKYYPHYMNHKPSVMITFFRDQMGKFFKKLLELGVTKQQLSKITGALREVKLHKKRVRRMLAQVHDSSRPPIGVL